MINRYRPHLAITLLCLFATAPLLRAVDTRPNIIFFLTDDQRNDTLGCTGHPIVKTPTIDGLAREGVLFRNSFCEVPICAASRSTLFTGLSQRTHGYNFEERAVPAKYAATSYPMLLKKSGYRMGFAGKFGMVFAGTRKRALFDFFRPIGRGPYLKRQKDGSMRHETELCGDAAIEFIEGTPEGKPFCMSVSFNASHAEDNDKRPGRHFQWAGPTDGMYEDVKIPRPNLDDEKYYKAMPAFLQAKRGLSHQRYFWRWDTPEKYQTNMRAYFRMLTGIDMTIARVMEVLKKKGLDQNTIIIYSADNGYMMGDRRTAGKWNHYEQSIRVPLVIYDPRVPQAKRGRVLDELVNNIDIAPTIVSYAGLEVPAEYQGRSLAPFVNGARVEEWREDIFCEHKFNHYPDWHCVRGKRFKYAVYYKNGPYECLYDLEKDPEEYVNLASNPEHKQRLEAMRARLEIYRADYPVR